MRVFTAAAFVLWSITVFAWAQTGEQIPPTSSGQNAATAPPAGQIAKPTGADSLTSIEQAFDTADLAGKLSIMQNEVSHPSQAMGPLYRRAIDYLTSNLTVLRSQSQAQELAVIAAHLIGSSGFADGAESTWQLFQLSDAAAVRMAAADAVAVVARGNKDVINKMNHWLAAQNLLHSTGGQVDPRVIDGCVRALAALEDASSFQVLFATMEAGYGEPTTNDARNAIHLLKGNRAEQLLQVVKTSRYSVRPAALEMAMANKSLTAAQKATIAAAALQAALYPVDASPNSSNSITALRFLAVGALGKFQWTPSAELIMTNFNRVAAEYQAGKIDTQDVVLSVDALSAMSTHEAAVRLSLYLGLINSMTEKGRHFDPQVTLAVVQGLGTLGDNVAFDNLSAMQYLDYPQSVKEAATQAVQDLSTS